MITVFFGILLLISIIILLYMAQKGYDNIDIRYWSILILLPIILAAYWFKTMVSTPEAAILCFNFIYLDSTILLMVLLFCIVHFMHITVKPWVKVAAYSLSFAHIIMVWLCSHTHLYYKSVTLIMTNLGTATKMESGPLKIVHWIYLVGILLCIIGVMVNAIIRKGTYSRRSFYLYTVILATGLVIYVVETVVDVDYSSLPVLYVLAEIMIAINYDHAHMHDINALVSEQQNSDGDRGYVAFDLDRRFLSCNKRALQFVPELSEQIVDAPMKEGGHVYDVFEDLIDNYVDAGQRKKQFDYKNMICECEINGFSLHRNGKISGYLVIVRDVTEIQSNMRKVTRFNETMQQEVKDKTKNIQDIQRRVVLGLANMVENRDNNTGGHVKRTSDIIGYVVDAVRKQGFYQIDDVMADDIVRAAPMHDLGKITIENAILLKPGKLTDEEYTIMKTHSVKSGEFVDIILKDVEESHFVSVAHNVARYHHERWDGRGYPEGLVGEMIPLEARIMAIADVYDALVSKRCYKKAMSFDKAAEIMLEGMGTQFDPNMYAVFQECRPMLEKYYSEN